MTIKHEYATDKQSCYDIMYIRTNEILQIIRKYNA